jgi:hypothetical protein
MSNIDTLRDSLFETIQKLKDGSLDVEKAKTIGDLSQVIINSAKVEVDFVRANGGGQSAFFSGSELKQISQTSTGTKEVLGNVTVHKLRG